MKNSFLLGALVNFSLIVSIGLQNIFILKEAIFGKYAILCSLIATLIDVSLISIGIFLIGKVSKHNSNLIFILKIGALILLLVYCYNSFKSFFFRKNTDLIMTRSEQKSCFKIILELLSVSLLNPHVYLDTVVLVGGIGAMQNADQKLYFAFGAALVSLIWFLSLGLLGKTLKPFSKNLKVIKSIELITGCTLLYSIAILMKFL